MKEQLKKLKIFTEFTDNELNIIEKYFTHKIGNKDEIVSDNNNLKKEIIIVLDGKITGTLHLPGNINKKSIEYITGDFFGELSLFGYTPLFNTFIAMEKSDLFVIPEKNVVSLIETNPEIAVKLISQLLSSTIQKLSNTNKFLAHVVQWGETASRRVITDELTGLYNREFLEDAIENFFHISKSNNKPLSLFMLDMDNFSKINEAYGIDAGNKILIEMVNLIKEKISKHGIIARYGGDEYSVLLPETDLGKAYIIAEHIRRNVEARDFTKDLPGKKIAATISIGISVFPDTATEIEAFREKADASLYKAKESGKNKVEYIE
ncbi:MAG: GGDEF domain-containing protein [Spirochaetota bacterium]